MNIKLYRTDSKKKALLLIWISIHFILFLIGSGLNKSKYFYPTTGDIGDYDYTEFLFYTTIPLLLMLIIKYIRMSSFEKEKLMLKKSLKVIQSIFPRIFKYTLGFIMITSFVGVGYYMIQQFGHNAHYQKGNTAINQQNYDKAIFHFSEALKIKDDSDILKKLDNTYWSIAKANYNRYLKVFEKNNGSRFVSRIRFCEAKHPNGDVFFFLWNKWDQPQDKDLDKIYNSPKLQYKGKPVL